MVSTNVPHPDNSPSPTGCKVLADPIEVALIWKLGKAGEMGGEPWPKDMGLGSVARISKEVSFTQFNELRHVIVSKPVVGKVGGKHRERRSVRGVKSTDKVAPGGILQKADDSIV